MTRQPTKSSQVNVATRRSSGGHLRRPLHRCFSRRCYGAGGGRRCQRTPQGPRPHRTRRADAVAHEACRRRWLWLYHAAGRSRIRPDQRRWRCKNALRMLKLPESIRGLVRDGTLPERVARSLVPYTVAPAVMKAVEQVLCDPKHYDHDDMKAALWGGQQPYTVREAIDEHTRPISEDLKRHFQYPLGSHPVCLTGRRTKRNCKSWNCRITSASIHATRNWSPASLHSTPSCGTSCKNLW